MGPQATAVGLNHLAAWLTHGAAAMPGLRGRLCMGRGTGQGRDGSCRVRLPSRKQKTLPAATTQATTQASVRWLLSECLSSC